LPERSDEAFAPKLVSDRCDRAAWAWNAFWDEQEANSRCLAKAPWDVRQCLDGHWARLAESLPPLSHILDIGCGAGIVGRVLLRARSDLRVTGIDLASVAPSYDRRLCLMSGTSMEDLPFHNQRFNAAVSQFGFEYGSITRAAKEVARVLTPGAPFSFIVHHANSPIVRDDRDRKRALGAILGLRVEHAFLSGQRAKLDRELELVRRGAPCDATVDQIAYALRSRLSLSCNDRRAIWSAIREALAPERELITALESSCVKPKDLDKWLAKLSGPLRILHASVLRRPNGQVIAWIVNGDRSACSAAPRSLQRASTL
jgi:SAM-dependent methyltransferase